MDRSDARWVAVAISSLVMLALGGCAGASGGSSGGACAGPLLITGVETATAGTDVVVRGENVIDGCVDGAANGTPVGTASPYASVEVVLTQADEVLTSHQAVPDADGALELTVDLPADLDSGPITLTAPDVVGVEALTLPVEVP